MLYKLCSKDAIRGLMKVFGAMAKVTLNRPNILGHNNSVELQPIFNPCWVCSLKLVWAIALIVYSRKLMWVNKLILCKVLEAGLRGRRGVLDPCYFHPLDN
jgi:hypothetical protein